MAIFHRYVNHYQRQKVAPSWDLPFPGSKSKSTSTTGALAACDARDVAESRPGPVRQKRLSRCSLLHPGGVISMGWWKITEESKRWGMILPAEDTKQGEMGIESKANGWIGATKKQKRGLKYSSKLC